MEKSVQNQSLTTRAKSALLHTIGLQTPGGRLAFFATVSLAVLFVPYHWLDNLSLWQLLGIPSPSIGLTRAYWKLIHLDPVGAYERNPLIYAIIAIGLPMLVMDLSRHISSRRYNKHHEDTP